MEHGYLVDIYSPDGGKLEADRWSDPHDDTKYSAEDILSLGFISSPEHNRLIENSRPLGDLEVNQYDGVLFVGGQGPMYTFYNNESVHKLAVDFLRREK